MADSVFYCVFVCTAKVCEMNKYFCFGGKYRPWFVVSEISSRHTRIFALLHKQKPLACDALRKQNVLFLSTRKQHTYFRGRTAVTNIGYLTRGLKHKPMNHFVLFSKENVHSSVNRINQIKGNIRRRKKYGPILQSNFMSLYSFLYYDICIKRHCSDQRLHLNWKTPSLASHLPTQRVPGAGGKQQRNTALGVKGHSLELCVVWGFPLHWIQSDLLDPPVTHVDGTCLQEHEPLWTEHPRRLLDGTWSTSVAELLVYFSQKRI